MVNIVEKIETDIVQLLPDPKVRKLCLSVLLDSVSEANRHGVQKWGVYFWNGNDRIRLLVGGLIVLSIHKEGVWMALEKEELGKSKDMLQIIEKSTDWQWDTGRWAHYTRIPSANGYYTPSDDHPRIWPIIQQFHFAYIRKTASVFSQLREDSQRKNMPEVLEYLRNTLKRYVPSPFYGDVANLIANPIHDIQAYTSTQEYQNVPETEREAIIQSRIGQGRFRFELIKYWGGCAVTGCATLELLRASHIKPWWESTHRERLDVYNGLLLTPNLDEAFDKGLISFTDGGKIMISKCLVDEEAIKLGIQANMSITGLDNRHFEYLQYHRRQIFKKSVLTGHLNQTSNCTSEKENNGDNIME